jgi:hypothetical protein
MRTLKMKTMLRAFSPHEVRRLCDPCWQLLTS